MTEKEYLEAKNEVERAHTYRRMFFKNSKLTKAGELILKDLATFAHMDKENFNFSGSEADHSRIFGRQELFNWFRMGLYYPQDRLVGNKLAVEEYEDERNRGDNR